MLSPGLSSYCGSLALESLPAFTFRPIPGPTTSLMANLPALNQAVAVKRRTRASRCNLPYFYTCFLRSSRKVLITWVCTTTIVVTVDVPHLRQRPMAFGASRSLLHSSGSSWVPTSRIADCAKRFWFSSTGCLLSKIGTLQSQRQLVPLPGLALRPSRAAFSGT